MLRWALVFTLVGLITAFLTPSPRGLNSLKLRATENYGGRHANSRFRKAPVGKSKLLCSTSWSSEDNRGMPENDSKIDAWKELIKFMESTHQDQLKYSEAKNQELIKNSEAKNQELIKSKDDQLKSKDDLIKYSEAKNQELLKSKDDLIASNRISSTREIMRLNVELLKVGGVLGLRGAIELYERTKSFRKAINPQLSRSQVWSDILSDPNRQYLFLQCFNSTKNNVKLENSQNIGMAASIITNIYTKLSNDIHQPKKNANAVRVELSQFSGDEVCVIRVLLQDLNMPYEECNPTGVIVSEWPESTPP